MKRKYRVTYQVRNSDRWDVWKDNIATYKEAECERLNAVKIFGMPARVQSYQTNKNHILSGGS